MSEQIEDDEVILDPDNPTPEIQVMIDSVRGAGFEKVDWDEIWDGGYWIAYQRENCDFEIQVSSDGGWEKFNHVTGDDFVQDRGIESLKAFLASIKEGV